MPQELVISSKLWDLAGTSTIQFTAQKGSSYYIQIAPRDEQVAAAISAGTTGTASETGGNQQGAFSLHVISEDAALRLLSELNHVQNP